MCCLHGRVKCYGFLFFLLTNTNGADKDEKEKIKTFQQFFKIPEAFIMVLYYIYFVYLMNIY